MNRNGVILWEGPSPYDGAPIVAIATGLDSPSANSKTGPMIQTWIMRQDVHPVEAIATGADASVCVDCPLRGDGTGAGRACYVQVGKAPVSVWRSYRSGRYRRATLDELEGMFSGSFFRIGSYGDPAMVPFEVWEACLRGVGIGRQTGYTHQWPTLDARWAGIIMASCDNVEAFEAAIAAGWRAFVVVPHDAPTFPSGTVECMSERERNPRQCADCLACGGTRNGAVSGAVSIAIRAHGTGAAYVTG